MSIDRLSEDLERFKDPATDITTRAVASDVEIKIVRDGEQRTYFYQGSTGRIDRRDITRRSYVSVRSLLASEDFADLSGFADTQRRILSQRQDAYLEPAGLISSGTSSDRVPLDMNTFLHITKPSTKERLQCILIDGPAGVGKTVLIERLVLARAQPPIAVPVLHVTSRGRRLTNLRDALAGTTTNLRAKFVPDEIPVLVRHGLIQVALDGFDEFVDPSGYQDAWAALKDFIRDCGTAGPIILAGRDTFFDQQSFQSQLQTAGAGAEITVVRLMRCLRTLQRTGSLKTGGSDLSSSPKTLKIICEPVATCCGLSFYPGSRIFMDGTLYESQGNRPRASSSMKWCTVRRAYSRRLWLLQRKQ